ncbi:MAG TPA: hypothetical protein VNV62_11880 [Trebonia sp.]|nr:hypothetical protein [Trebonia sp.]
MTDGQDYGQPGQNPQPGDGQQRPQGWPRRQPDHGQQYPPEGQPWQPQYDPRQDQRRASGPPQGPWQQGPYPPQAYPPQNYPPQGYPPQDYPPRDQWQPQQPPQDYGQFQPRQPHHRKRSRAPLYAGIAGLIVIAGGGTAYALAGHGGTPSRAAGGTKAAAKPASLSQLKKIVLQPADLPAGWKGTAYQADPNDSANDATLMRCVGARDTDGDKVAEANSDNFGLGNASISSSATSYRSQSDLDSDVTTLHSPKLSTCFGQMMKKQLAASLPAGATTESASIKILPGSAGGPANVVATGTGTIKVRLDGQQVSVYLTVAFITGPLIESELDAENVGTPVPASVMNPLVATVATRAAKG